jgi:hypothetical protein
MTDGERQELLGRLDERTERMLRILEGNGTPGLVQRVDVLESITDRGKGIFWLAGGSGLLGALSAIYHWFTKH